MCVMFLLSLGTIAACAPAACLDESGLYLSILVYLLGLIFVFSSSLAFISLAFISHFSMLLLLFFRSLVRLASLSSLFSIRARRRGTWAVLRGGLAALCLVSQLSVRSRGALLRRLGLRRWPDARVIRSCSMGGLALPYPRPSPLHVQDVQERFSVPSH